MLSWLRSLFFAIEPLVIGPARRNQEECRLRRLHLEMERDLVAEQRIKDRMMQGTACTHPSWYELRKKKRRPRRQLRVVPIGRKVEHG